MSKASQISASSHPNPLPKGEGTRRAADTWAKWILTGILIVSFAMKLPHLGHKSLKGLDESFHAIVAANLLKHPLKPTLNDGPTIPTDAGDWQNTHIWLHKPPMALWQIDISFLLLGVNTFALRFPSVVLSTLAVLLTYLIGRELLDKTAALIAAALQAFNPVIAMIVHGYVFSDHVDIALLFYVELSIYFFVRALSSNLRRDFVLAGVAQGLAFLSKTYPAFIVSGLVVFAWAMPRLRLRGMNVLIVIGTTIVTILPWTLYAAIRWPDVFIAENLAVFRHFNTEIEGWGAPWDKLVFDYALRVFYLYYPAILAAVVVAIVQAIRKRDSLLGIIIAWAIGVFVPNVIATSKPPVGTLIGWPALWLLLGYLISNAIRGDKFALGTWLAAMLLPFLLHKSDMPMEGAQLQAIPAFVIMREHIWVLNYTGIALAFGFFATVLITPSMRRWVVAAASVAMLVLGIRTWGVGRPLGYAYTAWRVTQIDKEAPTFSAMGQFIRSKLPGNAVILVEEQAKLDNKLLQFAADRNCYAVVDAQWETLARQVVASGGAPYLVTSQPVQLPTMFVDPDEKCTLYECPTLADALY